MSILTGDIEPTSGSAYINGSLLLGSAMTNHSMGYCPQIDPLLDQLNAFETLWFFGRIRGIPTDKLFIRIQLLVEEVGLSKFAFKPCGSYSGGNRRKLSLAVSLIGNPSVIMLDEPSCGRRLLTIILVYSVTKLYAMYFTPVL